MYLRACLFVSENVTIPDRKKGLFLLVERLPPHAPPGQRRRAMASGTQKTIAQKWGAPESHKREGEGEKGRTEWLPALPRNPLTNPEFLHTHACFTDRWTANLTSPVHAINNHETREHKTSNPLNLEHQCHHTNRTRSNTMNIQNGNLVTCLRPAKAARALIFSYATHVIV